MNAAHFTIVPLLRGRRERAPFVPSLRLGPTQRARRVTRERGRPGGARRRPPGPAMTHPEGFLGIWLKGVGRVRAPVLDSNRARYDRPPRSCWDVANLRIRPRAPRATCWIRNANGFLGRCESANLSRLLTRRTFARGADRRAISSSSRTSQRGPVNGAPRYMPRGLRLFPAEFAGVCALPLRRAPRSCSRGERRARRAGLVERARDAVRALFSVPSGERNREKFNRSRDCDPAFSSPARGRDC